MDSPLTNTSQPFGNAEPSARSSKKIVMSLFSCHGKKPDATRTKDDLDILIDQKTEEIENLKRQVNEQAGEIQSLKERIKVLEEELRSLQGDHNILLIGEMCRRLQANLYQYVFPHMKLSPFYSGYKLANLDRDIENAKSKPVKTKAKKKWEEFERKEKLKRFQDLIKNLQELRNKSAHPEAEIKGEIGLENVNKAAEELNKQGGFEFLELTDFCFEDVKEVIEIWYRTETKYVKKE